MTSLSIALLWLVVLALAISVLALARQVGVLHERIAPAGALLHGSGPGVGDHAPKIEVHGLAGNSISIGAASASGKALLLIFVSQTCPVCKKLIPIALNLAARERLDVLFLGDAELTEQKQLIAHFAIDERNFVNGPTIGMAFRVDKLPYAVLLDDRGVIAAKGLVNTREHLESLIVAKETGFESIQSYLSAEPRVR